VRLARYELSMGRGRQPFRTPAGDSPHVRRRLDASKRAGSIEPHQRREPGPAAQVNHVIRSVHPGQLKQQVGDDGRRRWAVFLINIRKPQVL
jgi:hypothetical protein